MIETLTISILILLLLGCVSSYTVGGAYILLLIAIAVFLAHEAQRKAP